jgi:hypothetical protein
MGACTGLHIEGGKIHFSEVIEGRLGCGKIIKKYLLLSNCTVLYHLPDVHYMLNFSINSCGPRLVCMSAEPR